jgi:hypothetical protein
MYVLFCVFCSTVLFCVLFVCVNVYCTVLLPQGVNPKAVNKYIISYHIMSVCANGALCLCILNVMYVLSVYICVCKGVLYYCHQVSTQLQLTNISYHIISYHIISYHIMSVCENGALCLCILLVMYVLSVYSVSLCSSVYFCVCKGVLYCTTANGCQPNCS